MRHEVSLFDISVSPLNMRMDKEKSWERHPDAQCFWASYYYVF